jgi:hypothetical protein
MIRERIYTIPVNDAFAEDGECALCRMKRKLSEDLVAYFLGASLMEPDVRVATNRKGFCREHAAALYNRRENRLGLALLLHTHALESASAANDALAQAVPNRKGGFLKRTGIKENLVEAAGRIEARVSSCAMCDRIEETMARYVDVVLWQYFEEKDFRTKFDTCKGFCLTHTADLLRGAARHLDDGQAEHFAKVLAHVTRGNLDRMAGELEGFTLLHDHRNRDLPPGASKDALPRMIRKLDGDVDLN